jgi:hypothetical protein
MTRSSGYDSDALAGGGGRRRSGDDRPLLRRLCRPHPVPGGTRWWRPSPAASGAGFPRAPAPSRGGAAPVPARRLRREKAATDATAAAVSQEVLPTAGGQRQRRREGVLARFTPTPGRESLWPATPSGGISVAVRPMRRMSRPRSRSVARRRRPRRKATGACPIIVGLRRNLRSAS